MDVEALDPCLPVHPQRAADKAEPAELSACSAAVLRVRLSCWLLSDCPCFPVPRNQLQSVAAACKVLIEFSLLRLENPDEACAVSQVRAESLFLTLSLETVGRMGTDGWVASGRSE